MILRGVSITRLRVIFFLLLFSVLLLPWVAEALHPSVPLTWRRPLFGSLTLGLVVIAVAALARREIRLREETERQYRRYFDDAPLGIYTLGREGRLTYANRKLQEITGYPRDELIGRPWQNFVLREDHPLVEEKIATAYAGGAGGLDPFEVKVYHRAGQILQLRLDYALLEKGGAPEGFLVVVQDVTRRRRLEAQLIKSERMAVAGQLAMGLAHEINNPLAIIKTSLRLMETEGAEGEENRGVVQDIQEEVDRIAGLVRVLLGFRDERPGEEQSTTVDDAVQSLLELMSVQARKAGVAAEFVPVGAGTRAAIRPSQFRQVLFNLVRNALDAMPRGGRLYISGANHGETVSIEVRDTGVGISHKDQQLVFEPFFSTKSSSHHGLGLYICYTIIKSVGGDIEVSSSPGEGATFLVRLPREAQAAHPEDPGDS